MMTLPLAVLDNSWPAGKPRPLDPANGELLTTLSASKKRIQ
jgi:hypothetical protein